MRRQAGIESSPKFFLHSLPDDLIRVVIHSFVSQGSVLVLTQLDSAMCVRAHRQWFLDFLAAQKVIINYETYFADKSYSDRMIDWIENRRVQISCFLISTENSPLFVKIHTRLSTIINTSLEHLILQPVVDEDIMKDLQPALHDFLIRTQSLHRVEIDNTGRTLHYLASNDQCNDFMWAPFRADSSGTLKSLRVNGRIEISCPPDLVPLRWLETLELSISRMHRSDMDRMLTLLPLLREFVVDIQERWEGWDDLSCVRANAPLLSNLQVLHVKGWKSESLANYLMGHAPNLVVAKLCRCNVVVPLLLSGAFPRLRKLSGELGNSTSFHQLEFDLELRGDSVVMWAPSSMELLSDQQDSKACMKFLGSLPGISFSCCRLKLGADIVRDGLQYILRISDLDALTLWGAEFLSGNDWSKVFRLPKLTSLAVHEDCDLTLLSVVSKFMSCHSHLPSSVRHFEGSAGFSELPLACTEVVNVPLCIVRMMPLLCTLNLSFNCLENISCVSQSNCLSQCLEDLINGLECLESLELESYSNKKASMSRNLSFLPQVPLRKPSLCLHLVGVSPDSWDVLASLVSGLGKYLKKCTIRSQRWNSGLAISDDLFLAKNPHVFVCAPSYGDDFSFHDSGEDIHDFQEFEFDEGEVE